ncbi:hypothetical protein [Streptomyces sp. NPDC001833]|uniref:hypothetical protein n=1 Tax=Streptomyces sp. NPDC001833 TaxID=3154658 RepID=UPI00331D6E02
MPDRQRDGLPGRRDLAQFDEVGRADRVGRRAVADVRKAPAGTFVAGQAAREVRALWLGQGWEQLEIGFD